MSLLDKLNMKLLGRVSMGLLLIAFSSHIATARVLFATGPGAGHSPLVKVTLDTGGENSTVSFFAYPRNFTGGVRVAVGDVNGDGVADIITAPGAGAGPHVKVFDGRMLGQRGALLMSFNAFPGFFRGGVFVAAGDVNGDGKADIITALDSGAPSLVRVFDGNNGNLLRSFFAYSPTFLGGVRVAAGDVNGDGRVDIITGAGAGGGPNVKVFDGVSLTLLQSFFAYDPGFSGGVFVAAGDVNGDLKADIVTGAGAGGGPHVKAFDGTNNQTLKSFFAYDASFTGGVRVAAADVNGDGLAEIITGAGPGAGPQVKVFNSTDLSVLHSFFAFEANYAGGVFVAGNAMVPLRR
jgi:FG-GAP-like repeat/FG-GAP repeat